VVEPKKKTTPKDMIAMIVRQFSAHERGVRAAAWRGLESTMQSQGITWVDVGDWIEHSYSEEEMLQIVDAIRKEERQRAQQSAARSNGHFALPSPAEMADFCEARRNWLKDDAQRKFIEEMVFKTHNQMQLHRGTLGYLASVYIKHGGKI
jgi:hypothetical protein